MPKLAELFLQFKEKGEVFVDGTFLTKYLSLYCQRVRFAGVTSKWTISALVPARVDALKILLMNANFFHVSAGMPSPLASLGNALSTWENGLAKVKLAT